MSASMDGRLVSPFLMWAIALCGAALLLLLLPPLQLLERTWLNHALAALLFMNWAGLFTLALIENREAAKSAYGISRLRTAGVYSLVRHPIYSADIGLSAGVFLISPSLNVLAAGCFVALVLYKWMLLEEKALTGKFGKKYLDYSRRVPRMVPRIF